jgi:hypothetical protein
MIVRPRAAAPALALLVLIPGFFATLPVMIGTGGGVRNLNGISRETRWFHRVAFWRAQTRVESVRRNRLLLRFRRQRRVSPWANRNDKDTVYAFDFETGREVWHHTYDCALDPHYYEGGTSATPAVDQDRVYSLSRRGKSFASRPPAAGDLAEKYQRRVGLKKPKEEIPNGHGGSPLSTKILSS